jgi:energy-coupling factor transporter transmembrane protein EcfT
METKDLFITPIFLVIIYAVAFMIRPVVTHKENRRYFIPGLTLKLIGALAVGFIYQFYYGGGDTFTYFHLGSRYIYEAFQDSPIIAFKLIFAGKEYVGDTFQYASRIYTYSDLSHIFSNCVALCFDEF